MLRLRFSEDVIARLLAIAWWDWPHERLGVAMGDVNAEQQQKSLAALKSDVDISKQVQVTPAMTFIGLDAYLKVIHSGVDVVLLASPPGFRPREIKAAVEAGKHIFAEKPMGTDAVNVKMAVNSKDPNPVDGQDLANSYLHIQL